MGQRSTDRLERQARCKPLWYLIWLVLAGLFSCANPPALMPASGYTSTAGRRSLAAESRDGVAVTADGSVWDGSPERLATEVTPLWVTLRNATGRPLRIQYDEFTLRGASGASYAALAPYVLEASALKPVFRVPDGGYFDKFRVAAYLAWSYPWLPVWEGPLPHGPSARSVVGQPSLPTASMLDRALPEGVLEDGGTASGYLYFQKVGAKEKTVTFQAELQEPSQAQQPAQPLASIDIPFRRLAHPLRPNASLYATPPRPGWSFP
ncbi:MAG TPA: hypothetical protein VHG72_19940 [Polyangia bacterium]|nr:hypothetical protein [Polyangia bacterium]